MIGSVGFLCYWRLCFMQINCNLGNSVDRLGCAIVRRTMTFNVTAPFKKVSQGVKLYPYQPLKFQPLKFLKQDIDCLLLLKNLLTKGFVLEEPKISPSSRILYQHVMRLVQDHGGRMQFIATPKQHLLYCF